MSWRDDIEQMEADDRAALRFWESPEEQACGRASISGTEAREPSVEASVPVPDTSDSGTGGEP